MFILSFTSSGLEFWSVNLISLYEDSESKVFKNINFLGEASNDWLIELFKISVYKRIEMILFIGNTTMG